MRIQFVWLPLALITVAFAIGCGAESPASGDTVFRVAVRVDNGEGEGWTEWVAPTTGQWRVEQKQPGGDKSTLIYSPPRWANVGHYVAVGSPAFIASFGYGSIALEPLRQHLAAGGDGGTMRAEFDGREIELIVEERITEAEARQRGLFKISASDATTVVEELTVGTKPSLPIKPYWFGSQLDDAEALVATQTRSHGPSYRYDVFYELPSAGNRTSASPNEAPPTGEVHVLSSPIRELDASQSEKQYMSGKHGEVVLASGETATLFPFTGPSDAGFAVLTKTTLVRVIGPAVTPLVEEERADLAARLRPL